jgi:hypothetical protein
VTQAENNRHAVRTGLWDQRAASLKGAMATKRKYEKRGVA